MPSFLPIGIISGLACAALFVSAAFGNASARLLLFLLTPLPVFIAGLGWGAVASAIASVVAAGVSALVVGVTGAGALFLSQGLPVIVLCYLANLARPVAAPAVSADPAQPSPTTPATTTLEWYPVGRMVAVATLMAALMSVSTIALVAPDLDKLRGVLQELLQRVFQQDSSVFGPSGMFKGRQLTADEMKSLVEIMLYALPAASGITWLGTLLLNLYLAGRVTLMSGNLARPWPDVAALQYPRGFGLGLAAALGASMVATGYPGLLASGFAGAFFMAYVLMGLALVHYMTRGLVIRPMLLAGLYLGLLLVNVWAAVALALFAVIAPLLPMRRPPASTG